MDPEPDENYIVTFEIQVILCEFLGHDMDVRIQDVSICLE